MWSCCRRGSTSFACIMVKSCPEGAATAIGCERHLELQACTCPRPKSFGVSRRQFAQRREVYVSDIQPPAGVAAIFLRKILFQDCRRLGRGLLACAGHQKLSGGSL